MISLQDVKEILLISAFLLVFSRALIIDMKRNFRKKYYMFISIVNCPPNVRPKI